MNVQTDTVQGTYRVSFRIAETGHYRGMLSARTVRAESREAAVASVPGGVSAEVLVWGPKDSH